MQWTSVFVTTETIDKILLHIPVYVAIEILNMRASILLALPFSISFQKRWKVSYYSLIDLRNNLNNIETLTEFWIIYKVVEYEAFKLN